jgi:uncharacterized protein YbjT (DUF2867 family)
MMLLIGATGTVGRILARALLERGVPCRALVRDPQRAREVLPPGMTLVAGDLARPETLAPALARVERMYLATNVHPQQVALQSAAIAAARSAGVRHVVKLSNLGADPASDFPIARWHGEIERALEASGMAWTHLRPHAFMQNLLHQAAALKRTGELAGPFGTGRIAMVDARDIAAVALAALTSDALRERTVELTGPAAVSYADVADAITPVLGREVRYLDVPPAEARRRMIAAGRPDWYSDALLVLYGKWAAGGWERIGDAVQRITGHPPRSLARFLADHAAAFHAA